MEMFRCFVLILLSFAPEYSVNAAPLDITVSIATGDAKVLITNDDGWASAQIRSEYDALRAGGYDVVLSCPAFNKSGTGNSTATPEVLSTPCQYDTCPAGSPPTGFNETDPRLNYVNAFPVDAARFGVETLAPRFFGRKPDLVVSGSNVGNNLGPSITRSGTCRAAAAAALLDVPAVAFSGATASQVSYTTLSTNPKSEFSIAANLYNRLTLTFLNTLLSSPGPILPPGVVVNVNYPSTDHCPRVDRFKWVFTRIAPPGPDTVDVETCGKKILTEEGTAIRRGCFATISVYNAATIDDVDSITQGFVLDKLRPILTCLPK